MKNLASRGVSEQPFILTHTVQVCPSLSMMISFNFRFVFIFHTDFNCEF